MGQEPASCNSAYSALNRTYNANADECTVNEINVVNSTSTCQCTGCGQIQVYMAEPGETCNNGTWSAAAVLGCTDSTALNYDSAANTDDGSCVTAVQGCMEPTAANYNPAANVDDGSCVFLGCTDSNALNYDSAANTDDGSCVTAVQGCMEPTAANYNPAANTDDGSCVFDAPYGTSNGRPAYSSELPPCAVGVVPAVQSGCLCSHSGDIRVIVAVPGERCDSDGYWGASKPSTGFYTTRDRDDENFGYSDTCNSKCQEAYHAITKTAYRSVFGRRLRSVNKLQASDKGQNMACTKKDQHYGANKKDFECYGCKQCEEDALTQDFGFKEITRSYDEDVGGCYKWCKENFDGTVDRNWMQGITDTTRKEKVCKWKHCSGCKGCSDFRKTAQNKFVHKHATVQDGDIMVGGCYKWCNNAFDGTVDRTWMQGITEATRKEKVCKWKRCSGCQACVEFAENANDDMNDGFRFKYATKDYSGTSTGRKKTTKREGGCKEWCKIKSQEDKADSDGHKGLDRICKWKTCNGCGVCETSTKRNKYLDRLAGNFDGDSAKKTAFENKYGSSSVESTKYKLPDKTIADARGQNLYGSNENDWKPGRGCAGLKCKVLYEFELSNCSADKACHNCGGC